MTFDHAHHAVLATTKVDKAPGRQLELSLVIEAQLTIPDDPADALAAVGALRRLAARVEDLAVERAVAEGWSFAQIAEALGFTRQAVQKKHSQRLAKRPRR
jgi:DNA-binding NarL/FixJ family response regulator